MAEKERYTLKEIDNFDRGLQVTDIILDKGIELPQSTVCDLLNEQDEIIKDLEKEIRNYRKISLDFGMKCVFDKETRELLGDKE